MAEPLKMPQLGSDMTEGTLLNWVKNVGDTISAGDTIAEIETDKATVEVPAEASGTILQLIGTPGDTLTVGSVIGYVGQAGEQAPGGAAPASEAQAAAAPAPAPSPQDTPPTGGNDAVPASRDQGAVAAETKTPPPSYGARPVDRGQANGEVTDDGNLPEGVRASPVARRIARQRGVDLAQVRGSGPNGRITREDVESYTPAPAAAAAPAAAGIPTATFGPLPTGPDIEVIDTSKLRSRIATRMVQSKQQVPHFYVTTEIDVEPLLNLRKQLNASVTDESQKVTVNDLIVKAAALTLREFPNLNSHFYGDKIVRHKRINIGIAVALEGGGLMNVVARDADKVSLGTLAAQNKEMIARAREGKVKPADLEGSTFTVSNLGAYDVDHFIAIINPPEAAILAVGTAKKVPIIKDDGTIAVGNRMKVTISVDHRVSDGAEGAQYMQAFKAIVENPMRLLM